jgi:hypothetical protein
MTSLAATAKGQYGTSTDPVSNAYLHTLRAYTGVEQYHDFNTESI